jgi:hypothetical protein
VRGGVLIGSWMVFGLGDDGFGIGFDWIFGLMMEWK